MTIVNRRLLNFNEICQRPDILEKSAGPKLEKFEAYWVRNNLYVFQNLTKR